MSLKKLSLKKETLLPMNDDQAQTVAGGLPITITIPQVAGAAACGGTIRGLACSNPCQTDSGATCVSCATCSTCVSCNTCNTCATNCACPTNIGQACSNPCRTDLCHSIRQLAAACPIPF